jgi:hypothetical protein
MIPGRVKIGPTFIQLHATRHGLFGVSWIHIGSSLQVWRYDGTPGAWTPIAGANFTAVDANDEMVYALSLDGTAWKFTGEPGQ